MSGADDRRWRTGNIGNLKIGRIRAAHVLHWLDRPAAIFSLHQGKGKRPTQLARLAELRFADVVCRLFEQLWIIAPP